MKVIVTHKDLDGVGCAVLFTKADPTCSVVWADYKDVNKIVRELLPSENEIVITDLSVDRETAALCNKRGKVSLLDHHASAEWLNMYDWAKVDSSICGTWHCYNVLSYNYMLDDLLPMVEAINDHDLWHHTMPRKLDRLMSVIGYEAMFLRLMSNSKVDLTSEETMLCEVYDIKKAKYIAKSVDMATVCKDKYGRDMAVSVGEQYVSDVGHALCAEYDVDYAVVFDHRNNKASLRSIKDCDVSAIAQEFGGGGHYHAAGFPLQ